MTEEVTAKHRKCLRNGSLGGPNGENEAQLYAGPKTLQKCLDRGWLERLPDSPNGWRMYRTTDLGRAMLNAPTPKKAKSRPKIKMQAPRFGTLDTRAAKPLPRKRSKS
jgi:hypothetical protein